MEVTKQVEKILGYYDSEHPGVRANLYRILMAGKLAGSGKLVILPVDQGFEHGPARSFAVNPDAYDPEYHVKLAIEAGLSAYAAPLGMLEVVAHKYSGRIPLILKVNSSNSLNSKTKIPDQMITSSAQDAVRLGCSAIGFTIYPGSDLFYEMVEELKEIAREAKSLGIAVVVWSYPRGGDLSKTGETALDICAYAAHMACLLGAHIIKVKLPTKEIEQDVCKEIYKKHVDFDQKDGLPLNLSSNLAERVKHIKQACCNGKRLLIFSGGSSKEKGDLLSDVMAIRDGGANGSIIGRNVFQRQKQDALNLLEEVIAVYLKKHDIYGEKLL